MSILYHAPALRRRPKAVKLTGMAQTFARALLAAAFLAGPAAGASFTLEPPPGWRDVTASKKGEGVLVALKGPETSFFVLTMVASPLALENRGATRAFLSDVLAGINKRTGQSFSAAGGIRTATYGNGLTAHYIRADLKGRPRLALAVMEYAQTTMLATLASSVPEELLPDILGALKAEPSAAGPLSARQAQSLDGQLRFSLPRGLLSRPLTEEEKEQGFVLAVRCLESELLIMKLEEEGTPVEEEPKIIRQTALAVEQADPASLSAVKRIATAAGPDMIYAWVRVPGGQFAAAYMPWCYWGYSILSKGPNAADLLLEVFETVAQGPSAVAKLVGRTPHVPIQGESRFSPWLAAAALAVLAAILVGYCAWKR